MICATSISFTPQFPIALIRKQLITEFWLGCIGERYDGEIWSFTSVFRSRKIQAEIIINQSASSTRKSIGTPEAICLNRRKYPCDGPNEYQSCWMLACAGIRVITNNTEKNTWQLGKSFASRRILTTSSSPTFPGQASKISPCSQFLADGNDSMQPKIN